MRAMRTLCLAGALLASSTGIISAQSASTTGAGSASGDSGTVGSGGSAAAGGTSASTLGSGGRSGDSATIGSGGSAATVDGKAKSDTKIHENPNMLHGQSRARAQDGGTWSRSRTKTKIKDDTLTSRTKSMAHEPGGPPAKSTTTESVDLNDNEVRGNGASSAPSGTTGLDRADEAAGQHGQQGRERARQAQGQRNGQ